MQINDTFRLYQKSAGRRPLRHSLRTGCAILAALCLAASAAWPQTCTVPPGVDQAPGGTNFFASFGSAANMGTYGTQLPIQNSGQVFEGDANSTYFSLYYSIANATALINSGNCPVELILVGSFPDARYFSITGYDMHYALAQKMLDADIDPAGPAYVDPFTPMTQYQTVQPYLVPISLGSLPGPMKPQGTVIPGCQIDPYEEDDLIDATQRHLSVDWNTIVQGSILTPSDNHVVDTASHINPNAAGDIVIRNYLAPAQTCGGDPITCTQPTAVPQPYLIVRDVYTGCAYSKTYVMNHLLAPPLGNVSPGNAIVATTDPSKNYPGQWLDQGQENDHLTFSLGYPAGMFQQWQQLQCGGLGAQPGMGRETGAGRQLHRSHGHPWPSPDHGGQRPGNPNALPAPVLPGHAVPANGDCVRL
jgi:hypothetical protein